MTISATPQDRRALAHHARLARAAHVRQLRRRAIAAALATFVLATGAVAWNGSMDGEPRAASTATSGSVLVQGSVPGDTADGWGDVTELSGSSSPDTSSSDDVVTTQQS